MKNKTKIIISITLFFALFGVVNAWAGPTAVPPDDNVNEPLNDSNRTQTKAGYLYFPKWFDSNNEGYYVDPASNSWLYRLYSYDVRADIFYDRNNTGYYLNPAGVSRLNDLYMYDDLFIGSSAGDNGADMYIADKLYDWDNTAYYLNPGGLSNLHSLEWIDGSCAAGSSIRAISLTGTLTCEIDDNTTTAEADTLQTVTNRGNTTSQIIQSNASVRAPIFYDSNNTGYYVNPASTSRLNYGIYNNLYSYGWLQSTIFYDANNNGYYVDPASNSWLYRLYSYDVRSSIYYDRDNTSYYVNPASTSRLNTVYGSAFLYNSDESLKKNINTIEKANDKILKLRGVNFEWKESSEKDMGFIAQEVEKILPELVKTNPDTGLKSVKYGNITALLVEALKEQNQKIEELEQKLNILINN